MVIQEGQYEAAGVINALAGCDRADGGAAQGDQSHGDGDRLRQERTKEVNSLGTIKLGGEAESIVHLTPLEPGPNLVPVKRKAGVDQEASSRSHARRQTIHGGKAPRSVSAEWF